MNVDLVKIFKVPTEVKCPECGDVFDAKEDLEDQDIEEYFCENPVFPEMHSQGLEVLVGCPKCDNSLKVIFQLNTTIKSVEITEVE